MGLKNRSKNQTIPAESTEKNQRIAEATAVKTDTKGYMIRNATRQAMYPADDLFGAGFGMVLFGQIVYLNHKSTVAW